MRNILLTTMLIFACTLFLSTFSPVYASGQFLWKPTSESNSKLVVLFPNNFRQKDVSAVMIKTAAGQTEKSSQVSQNGHNGDRIHARFGKGGSAYGNNASVILQFKNGSSRIWKIPSGANRYESMSQGTKSGGGNTSMDDVIGITPTSNPTTGKPGTTTSTPTAVTGNTISVKGGEPKKWVAEKDGEVSATASLRTFGPAKLSVIVMRGKEKINWLSWERNGDSDPSPLQVNGKEYAESMFEENPGDMSAQAVTLKFDAKKGDIFILELSGEFGAAKPQLTLKGKEK